MPRANVKALADRVRDCSSGEIVAAANALRDSTGPSLEARARRDRRVAVSR